MVNGLADDGFDLVHRGGADAAEAQTQDTESLRFISVGKLSVFHDFSSVISSISNAGISDYASASSSNASR